MEDDDDFREFLKVDKQYFDATKEERDRLQPDFERAINKVVPGLLEKADTRLFNGDYLKDMVNQCVNRGLARGDLTSYGRINLIEDADAFNAFFKMVREHVPPKIAALIYAGQTATLFIGMRSGHDPDAVEKLRRQAVKDNCLTAANTTKETQRTAHATDLIRKIAKDHPEFYDVEIAEEVPHRWTLKDRTLKDIPCLKPRRLGDLVRAWRKGPHGLPRPTGRRRFPLRRAERRLKGKKK
jgi:hypothetical protein